MAKLISQLYGEVQPVSVCPGKMEPFKDDLSTHGHLTSLGNKPQQSNLENSQHKYPSELLVNVYSYHVMVKVSVAVVWMEATISQIYSEIVIL